SFDTGPSTQLGYVLRKLGDKDQAKNILDQSIAVDRKLVASGNDGYAVPYDLARLMAIEGNKTDATSWLRRAIDSGWRRHRWIMLDPMFETIRDEEQFRQVVARLQSDVEAMRHRIEMIENPE